MSSRGVWGLFSPADSHQNGLTDKGGAYSVIASFTEILFKKWFFTISESCYWAEVLWVSPSNWLDQYSII